MMVRYHLSPDLHFALCATRVIFLDVARARYFCLPIEADAAFRQFIRGDQSTMVLERLASLRAGGYLHEAEQGDTIFVAQSDVPDALEEIDDVGQEGAVHSSGGALAAAFALGMAQWVIGRHGFSGVIDHLRRAPPPGSLVSAVWRPPCPGLM